MRADVEHGAFAAIELNRTMARAKKMSNLGSAWVGCGGGGCGHVGGDQNAQSALRCDQWDLLNDRGRRVHVHRAQSSGHCDRLNDHCALLNDCCALRRDQYVLKPARCAQLCAQCVLYGRYDLLNEQNDRYGPCVRCGLCGQGAANACVSARKYGASVLAWAYSVHDKGQED